MSSRLLTFDRPSANAVAEWTIVDPASIADDLTIPAAFRNPPEGRVVERANRQIGDNPPSMRLRRIGEKVAIVAPVAGKFQAAQATRLALKADFL